VQGGGLGGTRVGSFQRFERGVTFNGLATGVKVSGQWGCIGMQTVRR